MSMDAVTRNHRTPESGIYGILNTINGKWYIGSTTDFYSRWANHRSTLRRGLHDNNYLQRAWNKYGEVAFEFRVLLRCDESALSREEERFIRELKSCHRSFGYNLDPIINGHRRVSEATRAKISKATKGKAVSEETKARLRAARLGTKASEEARKSMSRAQKGRRHSEATLVKFRRHRHSKETKAKIAAAHVGMTPSEATREKLRRANLGKTYGAETRAKIAAAIRGRKFTAEHRARLSASNHVSKALLQMEKLQIQQLA